MSENLPTPQSPLSPVGLLRRPVRWLALFCSGIVGCSMALSTSLNRPTDERATTTQYRYGWHQRASAAGGTVVEVPPFEDDPAVESPGPSSVAVNTPSAGIAVTGYQYGWRQEVSPWKQTAVEVPPFEEARDVVSTQASLPDASTPTADPAAPSIYRYGWHNTAIQGNGTHVEAPPFEDGPDINPLPPPITGPGTPFAENTAISRYQNGWRHGVSSTKQPTDNRPAFVSQSNAALAGSPVAEETQLVQSAARMPVDAPAPAADPEFSTTADDAVWVPGEAGCMPCAQLRNGVWCAGNSTCRADWDDASPIPWDLYMQGEYVGPARLPHLPEYRLRVDDLLEFVYRLTVIPSAEAYRLNVGDTIRIESMTAPHLNRDVLIQPDGNVTVPQLGQVTAANRTITELAQDLETRYQKFVKQPTITVTPITLNTKLLELRATVDSRAGVGGQSRQARVTPEGTVQLPALGSVPAQGLTLHELKREIERRYSHIVSGIEVTPILVDRAPRFIYVVGEVNEPGRIALTGPTTVLQAIAMAGSWRIGARLNHVVVLRRDENWQLMAVKLRLQDALFGKEPCPQDEIWLRDSDIVILPKRPIQWTGDLIEMIFTRGIYGVVPAVYTINFARLSII